MCMQLHGVGGTLGEEARAEEQHGLCMRQSRALLIYWLDMPAINMHSSAGKGRAARRIAADISSRRKDIKMG